MKHFKFIRSVTLVALGALLFTACKKTDDIVPLGDGGHTFVKIIKGGSPFGISKKPIDFVNTPTRIVAVDLRRDVPNKAELDRKMTVTVVGAPAAVTAANAAYLPLNPAWYTVQTDAVVTGGVNGTFTFTFNPGEASKQIYLTIPDATLLNPSALYGVGYTITSADADGIITDEKTVVVEVGAKNRYDGVYSVESGYVLRYTAPGSPEVGGTLSGPLVGNPDVVLFTTGANSVGIPIPGEVGALFWTVTAGSQVAGVNGISIAIDPVTFLTTATCSGNATLTNFAGQTNSYNPATKTFNIAMRWNPTGATREYVIELKYKGPR